jgi:diacylglycerol kinase family enzyme
MHAVAILNRNKAEPKVVAAALKAAGIDAKVESVDGDRITKRCKAAVEWGAKLLIVVGGDGSVSAAAQALAGTDCALGILPLGTLNHLARDLGLPFELEKAAAAIASGKPRAIDVAEVNGRVFVNNAAIGLYPLMVLDRDSQQDRLGRSKRLALLVASARTLLRFHHQRLRLRAGSGDERVDTPLLFVGNNDYQLAVPGTGQRETLDDGCLSILVMRKKNRRGFLAAVGRALLGMTREDDMERMEAVKQLQVDSERSSIEVALDGEPVGMRPPLKFGIRPKALKVIAPA